MFCPVLSEESSACPDLTIETDRILPSVPGILFYESFWRSDICGYIRGRLVFYAVFSRPTDIIRFICFVSPGGVKC